jgi:hypothetical protein
MTLLNVWMVVAPGHPNTVWTVSPKTRTERESDATVAFRYVLNVTRIAVFTQTLAFTGRGGFVMKAIRHIPVDPERRQPLNLRIKHIPVILQPVPPGPHLYVHLSSMLA